MQLQNLQAGAWWWEVGLRGKEYTRVYVDISATPNPDEEPIHVEAWVSVVHFGTQYVFFLLIIKADQRQHEYVKYS